MTDTDAKSYRDSTSAKVLERAAREKRAKYKKACFEQWRSFMALVYSVDGMADKGARAYKKRVVWVAGHATDGNRMVWTATYGWSRGRPPQGLRWKCSGISAGSDSSSAKIRGQ